METPESTYSAFGELTVAQITPETGWMFHYNINTDFVTATTENGGTVTQSDGQAVLSTSAASNGRAKLETIRPLRYHVGFGGLVRFTARFTSPAADSLQIAGIGDDNDGLFVGYNGESFGVMKRRDSSDEWYYLDEGGHAIITPNYDLAKGNVFQIRYQWLGYGAIEFYIENPSTGGFDLFYRWEYASANTIPSIFNPQLPIMAEVKNTGNTGDLTLATASAMGGVEGTTPEPAPISPFALTRSLENEKNSVSTQTNILTLRNKSTYASKANRVNVKLLGIVAAVDGTKIAKVRLTKGATLGGSPSYSDVEATNSPIEYDTAGTTVTGGTQRFVLPLGKTEGQAVNIEHLGIVLGPGEWVTASIESDSSTDGSIALDWAELF